MDKVPSVTQEDRAKPGHSGQYEAQIYVGAKYSVLWNFPEMGGGARRSLEL